MAAGANYVIVKPIKEVVASSFCPFQKIILGSKQTPRFSLTLWMQACATWRRCRALHSEYQKATIAKPATACSNSNVLSSSLMSTIVQNWIPWVPTASPCFSYSRHANQFALSKCSLNIESTFTFHPTSISVVGSQCRYHGRRQRNRLTQRLASRCQGNFAVEAHFAIFRVRGLVLFAKLVGGRRNRRCAGGRWYEPVHWFWKAMCPKFCPCW